MSYTINLKIWNDLDFRFFFIIHPNYFSAILIGLEFSSSLICTAWLATLEEFIAS